MPGTLNELSTRIAEVGAEDARKYVAEYGFSAACQQMAQMKDGSYRHGWREALRSLAETA